MAGIIRVTPEQLEEKAQRYQDESGKVEEQIGVLRGLINQLQDEWEGESSRAFAQQYEELEPSFKQMAQLLADVSRQLDSTAKTLRDTDQTIASQIRG
jgi:WXG100 family type VII secretion target